jgi:hypothetical protein
MAWYGAKPEPGLYKDILPAWSDSNLLSLCQHISAPLFLAHVRASTEGETARANCHPFTHGNWSFMHNGQTGSFTALRRLLEASLFCQASIMMRQERRCTSGSPASCPTRPVLHRHHGARAQRSPARTGSMFSTPPRMRPRHRRAGRQPVPGPSVKLKTRPGSRCRPRIWMNPKCRVFADLKSDAARQTKMRSRQPGQKVIPMDCQRPRYLGKHHQQTPSPSPPSSGETENKLWVSSCPLPESTPDRGPGLQVFVMEDIKATTALSV